MPGLRAQVSRPVLTIIVSRRGPNVLEMTTYGIRAGRYGSLGRVTVETDEDVPVEDVQGLARVVLTALYGLDYDL